MTKRKGLTNKVVLISAKMVFLFSWSQRYKIAWTNVFARKGHETHLMTQFFRSSTTQVLSFHDDWSWTSKIIPIWNIQCQSWSILIRGANNIDNQCWELSDISNLEMARFRNRQWIEMSVKISFVVLLSGNLIPSSSKYWLIQTQKSFLGYIRRSGCQVSVSSICLLRITDGAS